MAINQLTNWVDQLALGGLGKRLQQRGQVVGSTSPLGGETAAPRLVHVSPPEPGPPPGDPGVPEEEDK